MAATRQFDPEINTEAMPYRPRERPMEKHSDSSAADHARVYAVGLQAY
jgi:hypothetical protein